jgi:structural maintenance of chromosome 2
MIDKV